MIAWWNRQASMCPIAQKLKILAQNRALVRAWVALKTRLDWDQDRNAAGTAVWLQPFPTQVAKVTSSADRAAWLGGPVIPPSDIACAAWRDSKFWRSWAAGRGVTGLESMTLAAGVGYLTCWAGRRLLSSLACCWSSEAALFWDGLWLTETKADCKAGVASACGPFDGCVTTGARGLDAAPFLFEFRFLAACQAKSSVLSLFPAWCLDISWFGQMHSACPPMLNWFWICFGALWRKHALNDDGTDTTTKYALKGDGTDTITKA